MKNESLEMGMRIGATVGGLLLLVFGMKPLIQSVALVFLAFNTFYICRNIQTSQKYGEITKFIDDFLTIASNKTSKHKVNEG